MHVRACRQGVWHMYLAKLHTHTQTDRQTDRQIHEHTTHISVSQRQLQRAVLSQRSKHSCGFNYILLSTSKERYILKSGGAPLFSSLARILWQTHTHMHTPEVDVGGLEL